MLRNYFLSILVMLAPIWADASVVASDGLSPANSSAKSPPDYQFDVYLDGKEIGGHSFDFEAVDDGYLLLSRANYVVKVLLIPFYNYSHTSNELWHNGCLQKIHSETDDNGKEFEVKGEQSRGEFSVEVNKDARAHDKACVRTFAYWSPELLDQSALLNSQTGEMDRVSFTEAGRTPVPWNGAERATTYELDTPKGLIRLWYGEQGRWLGLQSRLKGGRTLVYQPAKTAGGEQ